MKPTNLRRTDIPKQIVDAAMFARYSVDISCGVERIDDIWRVYVTLGTHNGHMRAQPMHPDIEKKLIVAGFVADPGDFYSWTGDAVATRCQLCGLLRYTSAPDKYGHVKCASCRRRSDIAETIGPVPAEIADSSGDRFAPHIYVATALEEFFNGGRGRSCHMLLMAARTMYDQMSEEERRVLGPSAIRALKLL